MSGDKSSSNILLQQSIALDRSTEASSKQILEAFRLLKLNPEEESRDPEKEWVLRWLLKKLNVDTILEDSLCAQSRAWQLLGWLITRLPTVTTARLLASFNLLRAIENVLGWLSQISLSDCGQCSVPDTEARAIDNLNGKIKKRKRNHDGTGQEPPPRIDATKLYVGICDTLRALTEKLADDNKEYAFPNEYFKSGLSAEPNTAAKILGCGLGLSAAVLRSSRPQCFIHGIHVYDYLISPAIVIWNLRSLTKQRPTEFSDSLSFASECLIPALRLRSLTTDNVQWDESVVTITQHLDSLIATNFVLPVRAAYLQGRRLSSSKIGNARTSLDQFFEPLRQGISREGVHRAAHHDHPSSIRHSLWVIYDIAIKSIPHESLKRSSAEAAWLQALLVQIAECLSLRLESPTNVMVVRTSLHVLKQMLHLALLHNVPLESDLLANMALQLSGISTDKNCRYVDWDLLGLCMKLDHRIVVKSPASFSVSGQVSSSVNVLLSTLLHKIKTIDFKTFGGAAHTPDLSEAAVSSKPIDFYDEVLDGALQPLLRSFTKNRDLMGFLNVWREQLTDCFRLESPTLLKDDTRGHSESVWSDEKLIDAVSSNIETMLTAGQVHKLLEALLTTNFPSHDLKELASGRFFSAVILMDCVISGCRHEDTLSMLASLVSSIYCAVTCLLTENKNPPLHYKWRIWRLKTTIVERFAAFQPGFLVEKPWRKDFQLANDLILRAFDSKLTREQDDTIFDQEFFAFRFLLIYCSAHNVTTIAQNVLPSIIDVMLGAMSKRVEVWRRTKDSSHSLIIWDGRRESLSTEEVLLLGCVAQLSNQGHSIRHLEVELQSKLFDLLYWSACWQSSTGLSEEDQRISWIWVWRRLVSSVCLEEDKNLSRVLCRTQVSNFLEIAGSPNIGQHGTMLMYGFSIRALQNIKTKDVKREERDRVVKAICARLLIDRGYGDLHILEASVNLLTKLMIPSEMSASIAHNELWACQLVEVQNRLDASAASTAPGKRLADLCKVLKTGNKGMAKEAVMENIFSGLGTRFARLSYEEKGNWLLERVYLLDQDGSCKEALLDLLIFLKFSFDASDRVNDVREALSKVSCRLMKVILSASAADVCILAMHCLDINLRRNAWAVTQWQIDSLLVTIGLMAATSAPTLGSASAPDIFTCLCRLFGTVLAVHRAKTGGRYHLMVPALQGLLRCFFEPYGKDGSAQSVLQQPRWLVTGSANLDPVHASYYVRLLTSISDPTVSAVSRPKKKGQQGELNDSTKKARRMAGQHLQYLIMEFCTCQLHGRVRPAVRSALNAGLWAAMDTMDPDTMRTVNGSLDPSGRAMFKVLYEDYKRFGRWEGV